MTSELPITRQVLREVNEYLRHIKSWQVILVLTACRLVDDGTAYLASLAFPPDVFAKAEVNRAFILFVTGRNPFSLPAQEVVYLLVPIMLFLTAKHGKPNHLGTLVLWSMFIFLFGWVLVGSLAASILNLTAIVMYWM